MFITNPLWEDTVSLHESSTRTFGLALTFFWWVYVLVQLLFFFLVSCGLKYRNNWGNGTDWTSLLSECILRSLTSQTQRVLLCNRQKQPALLIILRQHLVSIKTFTVNKALITMNDRLCLWTHLHASKDESNKFKLSLLQSTHARRNVGARAGHSLETC